MKQENYEKWYAPTPTFTYNIVNPRAREKRGWVWDTPDCCIRALALGSNADWVTAYDYLSTKARRDFSVPNDGVRFRAWVKENGAIVTTLKPTKGVKRMTAGEFAKTHKTGRFVLEVSNHCTVCINGVIHDAWNCSDSALVAYIDMSTFRY